MSRSIGLAHIIRHDDGTSTGVWGVYTIHSAFQPIFEFQDGKLELVAFEGLVRPFRDGEAVSPLKFFDSIPQRDRMEIETLTRTLHLLNAGACLDSRARLFVNFDPSLFADKAIADKALREMRLTLHEAGIDSARIVCEVTEHRVESHEALVAFVGALRAHRFVIAVDDYGSHDSDMTRIRGLHPDIAKFDARWTRHLMASPPGFELLKTMVESFEGWGITTLFEGIENSWQLDLAAQCGVRMVQGFALARPELAPTQFAVFSDPRHRGGAADPGAKPGGGRDTDDEAPKWTVAAAPGDGADSMPAAIADGTGSAQAGRRVFGKRGQVA